ncbi:hypothetical protein BFG52_16025 [Acinetobacter larvae]|uniref:Uncharacterized protein n=1 Tax=Acinetobacter larvae TaxID=1789224 RepID=A0A1B2M3C6_9GAMM|nr:hypothetical protein BFG52_16025 [Acinetobacter larvae]
MSHWLIFKFKSNEFKNTKQSIQFLNSKHLFLAQSPFKFKNACASLRAFEFKIVRSDLLESGLRGWLIVFEFKKVRFIFKFKGGYRMAHI